MQVAKGIRDNVAVSFSLFIDAPSLDPYIFQRLHSWPQDDGGLAKFNSFQGYLGFLSTQIHPLKSITPIFFYKIKKTKKPDLLYITSETYQSKI